MTQTEQHAIAISKQQIDEQHLQALMTTVHQTALRLCERGAALTKRYGNAETGAMFETLKKCEEQQIRDLQQTPLPEKNQNFTELQTLLKEDDLITRPIRELIENPYLLSPRRACQIAILFKNQVFQLLSTLAASQTDTAIRQKIETFATLQLKQIAGLRLYRLQAWKKQAKPAIRQININPLPTDTTHFNKLTHQIETIIVHDVDIIETRFAGELPVPCKQALGKIRAAMTSEKPADADKTAAEAYLLKGNKNLFSGMKALLAELEAAANLFLTVADHARSENLVEIAQDETRHYLQNISVLRSALDQMLKS